MLHAFVLYVHRLRHRCTMYVHVHINQGYSLIIVKITRMGVHDGGWQALLLLAINTTWSLANEDALKKKHIRRDVSFRSYPFQCPCRLSFWCISCSLQTKDRKNHCRSWRCWCTCHFYSKMFFWLSLSYVQYAVLMHTLHVLQMDRAYSISGSFRIIQTIIANWIQLRMALSTRVLLPSFLALVPFPPLEVV